LPSWFEPFDMLRALIAWLRSGGESADTDDREAGDSTADSEGSENSSFLRSRLDASVLSAHGGQTQAKSVQELEDETRELEEQLPDEQPQFDDQNR
jgi:hypothetical protein